MPGTILDARSVAGNKRERTLLSQSSCASGERCFINHGTNKVISDGEKFQTEGPENIVTGTETNLVGIGQKTRVAEGE